MVIALQEDIIYIFVGHTLQENNCTGLVNFFQLIHNLSK
jgi:hypothetical protein